MLGAGGRLNPQGPPCQSRLGRVTPVPQLSQSRLHGGFDETEQHRRNSSPAGCAGPGGPRGGPAPCGKRQSTHRRGVTRRLRRRTASHTSPAGTPSSLSVDENTPPGTNIGAPIRAMDPDESDLEYGDTLTYSLEATADTTTLPAPAASFDHRPFDGADSARRLPSTHEGTTDNLATR